MSKSKNPLQATGHQICNETGSGIFDPRGSRQMDAPACPFGSLHTGIKICGLTRPEDIAAVNEYRPDYIGFVFAPSKRNVSEMRAAGLKKLLSPDITAVGVFVNSPIDDIVRLVSRGIIGAVQLHGDMEGFETVQYAEDLKKALAAARLPRSVPLIRAVRVKDGDDIRRAVTAAVDRRRHSPIPSAAALDYKETIRRNLKNYNPDLKKLVPERFYFYDRTSKNMSNRYTVILDVDQSGSMGESVIYSSVISCILASLRSLKTHIVAFDTNVVDLTEKCDDPVDLLFGFQLGGGTDIEKSVAYCQQLIDTPKKTLFFLISDLMEGGSRAGLLRRLGEMKDSGVSVICLLAIADGGRPYYDEQIAGRIASMGIPCFACNPQKVPQLLERALKGQDLNVFQKDLERAGK